MWSFYLRLLVVSGKWVKCREVIFVIDLDTALLHSLWKKFDNR